MTDRAREVPDEATRDAGDIAHDGRLRKKLRKQRPCYSCEECRRVKLKCDRQAPCSNCVRRNCTYLCRVRIGDDGAAASQATSGSRPSATGSDIESLVRAASDGDERARRQQQQQHFQPNQIGAAPRPREPESQHARGSAELSPFGDGRLRYGSEHDSNLRNRSVPVVHLLQPSAPPVPSSQTSGAGPSHTSLQASRYSLQAMGPSGEAMTFTDTHLRYSDDRESGIRNRPGQLINTASSLTSGSVSTPSSTELLQASGVSPSSSHIARGGRPIVSQSADDAAPDSGSCGILMISEGGRSKYLGPTAGSEWLKDSDAHGAAESTSLSITRPSSPARQGAMGNTPLQGQRPAEAGHPAFPFSVSSDLISTRDLLASLPPKDDAWALVESYYRWCAWHHDVAPRTQFQKTFARVYSFVEGSRSSRVNPQELALVFIMLAQGTTYNIEMAYDAVAAERWLHLSEAALVRGDFLSNNTVAGLQTMHLMAHMRLNWDKGSRGDKAWPLWGLVMRLIQAMGMHRDGARWNLPDDVVEERRKVFWECHAADVFQAHCFSRPCAINPEHCDTKFPTDPASALGEKSYFTLRFELSQLSSEILNMAMKIRKPTYIEVLELDSRLSVQPLSKKSRSMLTSHSLEFERLVPFNLRSRTAYLAMPSRFPLHDDAIQASPEPSGGSLSITFQRMNLAFNISETIINLHRPYYAKALYAEVDDHVRSAYASSFLTVVERCSIIIALVRDIQARFPNVSTRQWNLWYHVFGSAICLGTLLLRDPANVMSSFVLAQIDAAIELFVSLIEHGGGTPRYRSNHDWLTKLRGRAFNKVQAAAASLSRSDVVGPREAQQWRDDRQDGEDLELVGWRTRLIERADLDHQGSKAADMVDETISVHDNFHQSMMVPSANVQTPNSTDGVLHDFWDPMVLQDIFGAQNDLPKPVSGTGQAWWENLEPDRA